MSATLYAEADGRIVPLHECDWALWKPCGCLQAIAVAAMTGHVVATEDDAWKQFYDRASSRKVARRGGMRVELVTHERWKRDLMEPFGKPCPHKADPS